jgi:hypothetical protein
MFGIGELLLGAAASVIPGLIGNGAQMSAQERAAALQEKGVQEWLKLNIPDPEQQKLALEKFISTGELTPEFEQAAMALDSELGKVQVDPRLKESRMRALASLEEQGYGGESLQDQAARQQALIESGSANRGRQEAVLSSMERRGQLGSGLELAGRMDAAQAEGDRLASNSLGLEADRRNRALASIAGAGDLAGSIQGDDYNMAANLAKSRDAINMFNTQNMQGVNQRNTDRSNDANRYNQDMKQSLANQNTGLNNFQQQYNKELQQQKFQNEAAKAGGVSGQYGAQAQGAQQAGQSAANMWGNIASGAGTLAYGVMQKKDKEKDK